MHILKMHSMHVYSYGSSLNKQVTNQLGFVLASFLQPICMMSWNGIVKSWSYRWYLKKKKFMTCLIFPIFPLSSDVQVILFWRNCPVPILVPHEIQLRSPHLFFFCLWLPGRFFPSLLLWLTSFHYVGYYS